MPDFVIQDWQLEPFDGDQAPTHVHHASEEAFVCLDGDLEVTVDGNRTTVPPGGYALVPRGKSTPSRRAAAVTSSRS
jgi:quercetin dioxygenase-like cupin family protein